MAGRVSPKKEQPVEVELTLNMDDLDVGEVEDIEDALGASFYSMINNGMPSMKLVRGMLWIQRRRVNPEYTIEEARSIKLASLAPGKPPKKVDPT